MGKVNKRGTVTAKRRPNGAKKATPRHGASGATRKKQAQRTATSGSRDKRSRRKAFAKRSSGRTEPRATYRIRGLDPLAKCGPATSVKVLYRVDERVESAERHHLVFFDRHGWYCEHGRDCPAVSFARRYDRALGPNGRGPRA